MYSAPVPGMEEEQDLFTNFENTFPNDTQEQEDEGDDSWNVAAFAKISVVSQQDTSRADTSCTEFSPSLFDSMEEHEDEEDDELDESVGTERSEPTAIMTPDPSFDESEKGKDDKDQEVPNIPESYSFSSEASSSEASSSESSSSSSESQSLSEDENDEETFESEENRDKETPEDTEGSEELTETQTSAVEAAPESKIEQDQESVPNVVRVESSSSSDDGDETTTMNQLPSRHGRHDRLDPYFRESQTVLESLLDRNHRINLIRSRPA